LPLTVHRPVVRAIVPLVPPAIVRLERLTVDELAVSTAPFPTVSAPPARESPLVARTALLLSVSVPPHRRPFAASVNVAGAVGLSWTLLNSFPARLANR